MSKIQVYVDEELLEGIARPDRGALAEKAIKHYLAGKKVIEGGGNVCFKDVSGWNTVCEL